MVVGTVDAAGRPVTRTVLCKSVDETGITFYTNYDSAKGEQLAATPYASATFPWYALGRQVHVRGAVTQGARPRRRPTTGRKRPRGSQLGAWASHQSQPIASREALLEQLADVTERFADVDAVPVPPNWGGYLIAPEVVEFWQGRENRVHNRIRGRAGRRASSDCSPRCGELLRRHHTAADAGLPPAVAGRHRHGHRRATSRSSRCPVQLYALTQNSAYVGLSGVFALVPAGRLRLVGRRAGPTRWTAGCC